MTTLRQALKQIRSEMADESYLPGYREYECDRGTLLVRNQPSLGAGSVLLGVFEAELVSRRGETVKTCRVR